MSEKTPEKGQKKQSEQLKQARSRIQSVIEQAEQEHRRLLLRKRIELANAGVRAYQTKHFSDAVKSFHSYLRILEDWKGVAEGGLSPAHFDAQKDVAELLLISGVYWDLAKLYDRTKSQARQSEFARYMEKYILFSKGMPFQALCAETLRKYIATEKPLHRAEFKNAYKLLGGTDCFVATALADVSSPETLPRLRRFRDETLAKHAYGRVFVAWYYRVGPGIAALTEKFPEPVRRRLGFVLDRVASLI